MGGAPPGRIGEQSAGWSVGVGQRNRAARTRAIAHHYPSRTRSRRTNGRSMGDRDRSPRDVWQAQSGPDSARLRPGIGGTQPSASLASAALEIARLVRPHRRATVICNDGTTALKMGLRVHGERYARVCANFRFPPRPWKNAYAEDGGPTSAVRLRQDVRADPGTQARIACSSGPTPRIAITRLML